jgi:stage II sporulation protein D
VHKPTPPPEETVSAVPTVRVALTEKLNQGTLSFNGTYLLRSEEATYVLNRSVGTFQVKVLGDKLVLSSRHRYFEFPKFQTVKLIPKENAYFVWNDLPYDGNILFTQTDRGVAVVNELPMPEYLKGVVPNEIPSHTRDFLAAVEAQTVAARSYAMYYLTHPESPAYHLFADVRHQVYLGRKNQSDLVTRAIASTAGLVLVDAQGNPVRSEFHSTCGGYLENGDNHRQADGEQGTFYCAASPFYRWMRTISDRDILRNLQRLGRIQSNIFRRWMENGFEMTVQVQHRTASGRVDRLQISVNGKKFLIKDWEIRRVLTTTPDRPLPGNLFFLKKSRAHADRMYVIGAGYGHGRGMCQWGAVGQALQGRSFRDILKFYYPDYQLKQLYRTPEQKHPAVSYKTEPGRKSDE